MIAAIEESFEIMIETDDIIDFGSYTKGIEIIAKYGVELQCCQGGATVPVSKTSF
jgi:hypothetical protein